MGKPKKIPKEFLGLLGSYLFMLILIMIINRSIDIDSIYHSALIYIGIVGISATLVHLICVDINNCNFCKHISLTFSFVGIINILYVLLIKSKIYENKAIAMNILWTVYLAEIILLFSAFRYVKKSFNINARLIVRAILILAIVYISSFIGSQNNSILLANKSQLSILNIRLLYIILLSFYICILNKNDNEIVKKNKKDLTVYSVLKIICIILFIILDYISINNEVIIYKSAIYLMIVLSNLISAYYIINLTLLQVIKKPNEVLYTYLLEEKIKLNESLNNLKIKETMEQSRNEVLSNISHELKTPITVIYSSVQMQNLSIKNNNIEDIIKFNGIIRQNCNRLIRLINNFIDSTKFETRNSSVNLKYVNIVSLIEYITTSVLPFAQNRNIELVFDTQEEELFCEVDIDFMERIMLNVLSNAIKYNVDNGNIYVYISNKNTYVNVLVKDSGIGIPSTKINNIFDRFDRINREGVNKTEGTGIGLNIVKHMVEMLSGHISITSEEFIGTNVNIQLPKIDNSDKVEYIEYKNLGQSLEVELSNI